VTTEVTVTTSTAVVQVVSPAASTVTTSGAATATVSVAPDFVWPSPAAFTVSGGTLGTQPTFNGAPLFSGTYIKLGALVHFEIQVDFDNITSFGSGQYYVNLPFVSAFAYEFTAGCLHDISASRTYPIFGHVFAGESQLRLESMDAKGNTAFNVPFEQGSPITLAIADNFHISGSYISGA
jgi:hypothetical protein